MAFSSSSSTSVPPAAASRWSSASSLLPLQERASPDHEHSRFQDIPESIVSFPASTGFQPQDSPASTSSRSLSGGLFQAPLSVSSPGKHFDSDNRWFETSVDTQGFPASGTTSRVLSGGRPAESSSPPGPDDHGFNMSESILEDLKPLEDFPTSFPVPSDSPAVVRQAPTAPTYPVYDALQEHLVNVQEHLFGDDEMEQADPGDLHNMEMAFTAALVPLTNKLSPCQNATNFYLEDDIVLDMDDLGATHSKDPAAVRRKKRGTYKPKDIDFISVWGFEQCYGHNLAKVAQAMGVSLSTLKRKTSKAGCRSPWPVHVRHRVREQLPSCQKLLQLQQEFQPDSSNAPVSQTDTNNASTSVTGTTKQRPAKMRPRRSYSKLKPRSSPGSADDNGAIMFDSTALESYTAWVMAQVGVRSPSQITPTEFLKQKQQSVTAPTPDVPDFVIDFDDNGVQTQNENPEANKDEELDSVTPTAETDAKLCTPTENEFAHHVIDSSQREEYLAFILEIQGHPNSQSVYKFDVSPEVFGTVFSKIIIGISEEKNWIIKADTDIKEWMSSWQIDVWGSFIHSMLPEKEKDRGRVQLVPTGVSYSEHQDPNQARSTFVRAMTDLMMERPARLYVVPFCRKKHWVTLFILPEQSLIYCLDPTGTGIDSEETFVYDLLMSFGDEYNKKIRPTRNYADQSLDWKIENLKHKRQPDTWQCGYYTMLYIEKIMLLHSDVDVKQIFYEDHDAYPIHVIEGLIDSFCRLLMKKIAPQCRNQNLAKNILWQW